MWLDAKNSIVTPLLFRLLQFWFQRYLLNKNSFSLPTGGGDPLPPSAEAALSAVTATTTVLLYLKSVEIGTTFKLFGGVTTRGLRCTLKIEHKKKHTHTHTHTSNNKCFEEINKKFKKKNKNKMCFMEKLRKRGWLTRGGGSGEKGRGRNRKGWMETLERGEGEGIEAEKSH